MIPNAGEVRILSLGDRAFAYRLHRTARQRTVGIFVEPDQSVVVLAPRDADRACIERILSRRMQWIRRQQRSFEAMPPPMSPREWVAGETHRYLGRQYRLKPMQSISDSVRLVGGYFVVTVPDPTARPQVRKAMEAWYRKHAVALLGDRVQRAIAATTWLDLDPPPIAVRSLKARWGSTTKRGTVTFNIDLIKLPLPCIDYVVAHELVHLKIPNHSPAFWQLLTRVMPDWRRWRDTLAKVEI